MYSYVIGQCGVKPAEYWQLTEAETMAIIAGHQRLESYDAEKFRNIYVAMMRYMGNKQMATTLWPLPTDNDWIEANKRTPEELEARKKRSIELAKKHGMI